MALVVLLLSLYLVFFRRCLSVPSAMLVSLVVTSVFKFSCSDQCKVSIQVTHHDVYVRLSLWLKLLVTAPESLYLILPCVPGLFNVGLEIAGNVSLYIRLFLHVALNIAARSLHYVSLKETLICLMSVAN